MPLLESKKDTVKSNGFALQLSSIDAPVSATKSLYVSTPCGRMKSQARPDWSAGQVTDGGSKSGRISKVCVHSVLLPQSSVTW